MKKITLLIVIMFFVGCTTVKYNGADNFVKDVDYPPIGTTATAYIGDHLVQKGTVYEESVLVVHKSIDGALYNIPAGKYKQIGYDKYQDFYSATRVTRGALADPIQALALSKKNGADLCVVTTFGGNACYKGAFSHSTQISEEGNSFQQTLIYSGRVGNKINVGYREFSNDRARPAFNNDVEYDLASSNTIGYKGALIQVLKADNSSITYKLLKNFR